MLFSDIAFIAATVLLRRIYQTTVSKFQVAPEPDPPICPRSSVLFLATGVFCLIYRQLRKGQKVKRKRLQRLEGNRRCRCGFYRNRFRESSIDSESSIVRKTDDEESNYTDCQDDKGDGASQIEAETSDLDIASEEIIQNRQ